MLAAAVWHNLLVPENVSGDVQGDVSPIDVLLVVEELVRPQYQDPVTGLLPKQIPDDWSPPFLDVSCDGVVSPLDALIVIDRLVNGDGEGGNSRGGTFATEACSPRLEEGTAFRNQLSQGLILPDDTSAVKISFRAPQFDAQSAGSMQDAFEIEITGADGRPLSLPYAVGRDAVFNWSESTGPAHGVATTVTSGGSDGDWNATVNLNGLPSGTEIQAQLRLVNNDSDEGTSVLVRGFEVVDAPLQPPAGFSYATEPVPDRNPPVLSELTDLSSSFPVSYGRSSLDGDNDRLTSEVTLTNRSGFTVTGRLLVAIGNVSDPSVLVLEPDGFLSDGRPFLDLSDQIPKGRLEPGQSVASRRLAFLSDTDERFHFELNVYGSLNRAPNDWPTIPETRIEAERTYVYAGGTSDLDGDPLTYSVVAGPEALTIDRDTGRVEWNTTADDVGNHQITLRATDPYGLFAEQTFSLEVLASLQNRPPVFVSTPDTEATAASGFEVSTVATGDSPAGVALVDIGVDKNTLVTINPGSQTVSQIDSLPRDNYGPPTELSIGEPAPSGDLLRSGYNIDIGFPSFVRAGDTNRIDGFDQGDINGDGFLDLVSNRYAWESGPRIRHQDIVVNYGDGNGGFSERDEKWPIPAPSNTNVPDYTTLAVADVTGDGWDDVLTLNIQSNELLLFENDGTGQLAAPRFMDLSTPIFDFKLVDLNQDGNQDLLAIPTTNRSIGYMLGQGDGTFADFQTVFSDTVYFYPFDNYYGRPYDAGDLDGDGDLDIAVMVNGASPRHATVLINDGNLNFTDEAHVEVFSPVGHLTHALGTMLEIGDFNGDGNGDMVIGTHFGESGRTGGAIAYVGDGTGSGFTLVEAAPVATFAPANRAGTSEPVDIDGDGDLDLLIGSGYRRSGGYEPSVLLNRGDATFEGRGLTTPSFNLRGGATADTEAIAQAVTVGDYNRDGLLDLAVARSNRRSENDYSSVAIILADRPGVFATGRTTTFSQPTNTNNSFFQSGDFNNDGYLDIWSPGEQSVSRTWLGDGSGIYSDDRLVVATPYIGNETLDMGFVEDFDQDGNLDVLWLGNDSIQGGPPQRVLVGMGNGDGTFSITFAQGGVGYTRIVRPADFNEDGYIDFATRSHGPQVDVWLYDPDNRGTFIRSQTFPLKGVGINVNGYYTALAVDDFDQDGHMDMATVDREEPTSGQHILMTWYGKGDGTFDPAVEELDFFGNPQYTTPYFADSGDFNEDGLPDIVTYEYYGITVHLNKGDRSFELPVYYPALRPSREFIGLHVLDLDGDGHDDIVFQDGLNSDQINVMAGRGDGTFEPRKSYDLGYSGSYLTLEDFDNDSKTDILAPTGSFAPLYTTISGSRPGLTGIVTLDIDQDGNDDVFAVNTDNSRIKWFLGDNLGNLTRQPDLFPDFGPVAIGTADFDGDSQTELFTVNHAGRSVSLFRGTPEAGFVRSDLDLGAGSGPVDGVAADVTGDGNTDLLVIDDVRNTLWVLAGNGDLTFATPAAVPLGDRPADLFVTDANGDGNPDALITLPDSKRLMILAGDGAGTFSSPRYLDLPGTPTDLAAHDFNDDGVVDIAATVKDTGQLAVFFGRGNDQFATPQLIEVGESPSSVALADADDDGRVDLLVTNAGDDTVSVIYNRFDSTQVFRYPAKAVDPDDDPVTYSLVEGPGGLILSESEGSVLWAPSADQVGQHRVTIEADDGRGGRATQTFVIDVQPARNNRSPVIASEPPATVAADRSFTYRMETRDADGDPLRYRLLEGPDGAELDPTTGELHWAGTSDGGLETDQDLRNKVTAPHSPSLELTDATLETWFLFDAIQPGRAQYLISKGSGRNVSYALTLWSGELRAEIGDGTTTGIVRAAIPFVPEAGHWYHFAMTFDDSAGTLRLYVDGEEVAMTATDQSIVNYEAPLQVGSPVGLYSPDGTFDNTRIWNVARTPEQIREGMSRQYDADANLVVDYRYNLWEAQSVIDYSSYKNDGILDGVVWPARVPGLAITNPGHFRVSVEDGRGGYDEQSFDVSFVPPLRGSIAGTVFVDVNGDGVPQSEEQVLPDWLVYADANGNAFPDPGEPQATTDAAGRYSIERLLPGDYQLGVQPRAGLETPAPVSAAVTANRETLVDFAMTELGLGQIRGRIETANDIATAHQQVFADLDQNGSLDPSEPVAMTDEFGEYAIPDLAAGDYDIRPVRRAGWDVTDPAAGVRHVTLEQGGIATGNDFTLTANNTTSESGLTFVTTPNHSGPDDRLQAGTVYRYQALAQNWSGTPIRYDVSLGPDGLSIDSETGLVIWRPSLNQLGEHRIVLRARDTGDGVALQDFSLNVVAPNTAPVITSTPPDTAHVGIPVVYPVEAQDAESSSLSFSLSIGPTSASIDPTTGVLRWTPKAGDVRQAAFAVTVTDEDGAETVQDFVLDVDATSPSTTPFAIQPFRTTAAAGEVYRAHVAATDALGRPIPVALTSGPTGMQLGTNGMLKWTPASNDIGTVSITLSADDGLGHQQAFPFDLEVSQRLVNAAPSITSDPILFAVADRAYSYDVAVEDVDRDALSFELLDAPAGMSIDRRQGRLRWTPPVDLIGTHDVSVRVVDAYGAEDVQAYELRVRRAGGPPVILSTPPTESAVGITWLYRVVTQDAEMDPLAYALLQSPDGMSIDAVTGEMSWTPDDTQVGLQTVAIEVTDGASGAVTQVFAVRVADGVPNEPPAITTAAERFGAVGTEYRYRVQADDPEGTTITYSLARSPGGMTIDSATGLVQWLPGAGDVGKHVVTIVASDEGGASALQSFELDILAQNRPPRFVSTAPTRAFAGELLRYDAVAQDADLDPLSYEIVQGPSGMSVDPFGTVTWQTSTADIGLHPVTLRVIDPRGGVDEQGFEVQVSEDTVPPRVVVNGAGFRLPWHGPLSFFVSATDNVGVDKLEVTVDDKPFTLQANGMGYLEFDEWGLGVHDIVATATDAAGNTAQATGAVAFCDPCGDIGSTGSGGVNNPLAVIASPAEATTVTGMVSITGTANIDGFDYYRLLYRRADQDQFTEFFQSSTTVTDGELGVWDTSLLENDEYVIRLEVVDLFGRIAVDDVRVGLSGALKLGNFRLSFTDLTIPVSGIPIQVVRTYDTLRADREGDFGFGWRLEFRDADLRVGLPKSGLEEIGVYTPMRPGVKVYMTLPGQERMGWTFTPEFRVLPGLGDNLVLAKPRFTPDPGNTARLQVGSGQLFVNERGELFAGGNIPWNPASPDFGGGYAVVTRDGLRYHIDGDTGKMDRVTDRNGNTVTFSDAGIESDYGVGIDIHRDERGRITAITDPLGNSIRYGYSAAGDLVSATDREGNETRYTYDAARAHYLQEVIDPLGRTGVRTQYDEDGRLVSSVDIDGNTIQFSHDVGNAVTAVTGPDGITSILEYDERGNVVAITDGNGNRTTRAYNSENKILSTTDSLGGTVRFQYDGGGRPVSRIDESGGVIRYTYGSFDQITSISDALGNTRVFEYDSSGNLVRETDPLGNATRYTYDGAGRLIRRTDAAGNAELSEYDAFGRPARKVDALGNELRVRYDANGLPISATSFVTTADGKEPLTVHMDYDANGNLVRFTDGDGRTVETTFDELGNASQIVDSLGREVHFTYDGRGRRERTVLPDGSQFVSSYAPSGRIIDVGYRNGEHVGAQYDAVGNIQALIYPDDTPSSLDDNPRRRLVFDAGNRLVESINEVGTATRLSYSPTGRIVRRRNGEGHETRYDQAANGDLRAVIDADGAVTRYEVDSLGRITAIVLPDGSTLRAEYDEVGNVVSRTDPNGNVSYFEYDALRRLTAVTNPLGGRTEYDYDEFGRVVAVRDALNRETRYAYTKTGLLTSITSPSGDVSRREYDDANRLVRTTDFNSEAITYSYDSLDQLVEKRYPDGSVVSFTYAPTGGIETIVDGRGLTSYAYDERGRLVERTEPDGRSVSYTYDDAGRVATLTTPGETLSYTYTATGRIATVADSRGNTTSYEYDDMDRLTTTRFPNGIREEREYDMRGRLTSIRVLDSDGVIDSIAYGYDRAGNVISQTELSGRRTTYEYDASSRLVLERIDEPSGQTRTITYTYDAVGNRLLKSDSDEGDTSYEYDVNDRLIRKVVDGNVVDFVYDANGNRLAETSSDRQVTLTWDPENRLTSTEVQNGSNRHLATYVYDGIGNRVAQTIDGKETRFLLDVNRPNAVVVESFSPAVHQRTTYGYGRGRLMERSSSGTMYYLSDIRGSTRSLVDENANVVQTYSYDAYGRLLTSSISHDQPFLFTGEMRDPVSGFDYLRARYLDVENGRFLSADPFPGLLGKPISLHKYQYADANPVNGRDPSGNLTLSEVLTTTFIISTLAAGLQTYVALRADSGLDITWTGPTLSVGAKLSGSPLSGGLSFSYFTSSPFRDRTTTALHAQVIVQLSTPDILEDYVSNREYDYGRNSLTRRNDLFSLSAAGFTSTALDFILGVAGGLPDVELGDATVYSPSSLGGIDSSVLNGAYFNAGISFGGGGVVVSMLNTMIRLAGGESPSLDVLSNKVGIAVVVQGFGLGYSLPDISTAPGFSLPSAAAKAGISIDLTPDDWNNRPDSGGS